MPLDLSKGRGKPFNPYLKVVSFLRKELKPVDLRLAPESFFEMPGMQDFNEWSLVYRWMQSWLQYQQWYCTVALYPEVSLKSLMKRLS